MVLRWLACTMIIFLSGSGFTASAAEFYSGKTIRLIVGASAGGGFDIYTRAIARYMSKHVPGNPTIIVDNMAGAGSLVSANYMYNLAKPDGLTVGLWSSTLILQQVMGGVKGIEFNGQKYEWIGVPSPDSVVCALTKASGVNSMETWLAAKEPVKFGGQVPGVPPSDSPRILKGVLNLPIQLIEGYKGTSDIRLAADAGEISGACYAWESLKVQWRTGIESGNVKVIIQAVSKRHQDLPDVPSAIEFAKTPEDSQLIKVALNDINLINRAYSLPPGTPKENVRILRTAFAATMKDPEFLSEAKKSNLNIQPISGEEVEIKVQDLFRLSPNLVSRLRDILVPKN